MYASTFLMFYPNLPKTAHSSTTCPSQFKFHFLWWQDCPHNWFLTIFSLVVTLMFDPSSSKYNQFIFVHNVHQVINSLKFPEAVCKILRSQTLQCTHRLTRTHEPSKDITLSAPAKLHFHAKFQQTCQYSTFRYSSTVKHLHLLCLQQTGTKRPKFDRKKLCRLLEWDFHRRNGLCNTQLTASKLWSESCYYM